MSGRVQVDADLNFVKDVIQAGGGDLKKCYQCSTCTVVCPLTPDGAPFPRKEMIHGQWGIKDKLIKSMDPWLCFGCNDCSESCPRGAKPGDVMAAIRSMIIQSVAVPSFIAKSAKTLSGSLSLLLLPIILIGIVLLAIHGKGLNFLEKTEIVFSNMLTVTQIDSIFVPAALFAVITAFLGVKNLINNIKEQYPASNKGKPLFEALKETVVDILSHKQFKECGVNKSRNIAHMLLMYGFIGLFITTTGVVLIHYGHVLGMVDYDTPLPFSHPMKILGNISAVSASLGILLIIGRRLFNSDVVGRPTAFDWVFVMDVFLVALTGVLAQITRVYGHKVAYLIYYFHLVFVFFLFAYAPHSKFGHMFYRTAALVYAKYSGREKSNRNINLLSE